MTVAPATGPWIDVDLFNPSSEHALLRATIRQLFTDGLAGDLVKVEYELTDLDTSRTIITAETALNLGISAQRNIFGSDGTCALRELRAFVIDPHAVEKHRVHVRIAVTDRTGAHLEHEVSVIAKWPSHVDGLPREHYCGL